MNIFNRVALQSLKNSRTRGLVTVVGAALSAALITAVLSFGISLLSYLAEGAQSRYGSWQLELENVSQEFALSIAGDDRVESASMTAELGCAPLEGVQTPDKPYLFISGYSDRALEDLPLRLTSGRLPENDSELVVSGRVSARGGMALAVGDTLTLAPGSRSSGETLGRSVPLTDGESLTPGEERRYVVVGICQTPSFEAETQPGYSAVTCTDSMDGALSLNLFVTLKDPRQVYAFAESLPGEYSCEYNNYVLRFMGLSRNPGDRLLNTLLYSCGAVVVAIIMVGAVFLIYNSFSISLSERTRQFGILMSVGATGRQLRGSVLFEGLCIGAVGIPPGVLLGLGGIRAVTAVVAERFADILYSGVPLTLRFSLPAVLIAAAVSMVTILISAYIPARRAAAMPVMDCLNQTQEIKEEDRASGGSPLVRRRFGLEAALAQKSFRRNRRRYRSVILSLVLSVVLFIAAGSFAADARELSGEAGVYTTMDLCVSVQDMDDAELAELFGKLVTADGVSDGSYQALLPCSCEAGADSLASALRQELGLAVGAETAPLSLTIQFIDDRSYAAILSGLGLSVGDAGMLTVAKLSDGGGADVYQLEDLFTADTVTVAADAGGGEKRELTLEPVEFVPPDSPPAGGETETLPYYLMAVVPYSLKAELGGFGERAEVKAMTFTAADADRAADAIDKLLQAEGLTGRYELLNMHRLLDDSRNYIFIVNVFIPRTRDFCILW